MAKTELKIAGGFSSEREPKIDSQRTINMYVLVNSEGKWNSVLAPMPGLIFGVSFLGLNNIRSLYTYKDLMYAVASNKIYRIDSNLTPTLLGTINTAVGYIGVTANETQLIWVDGGNGYIYDTSTSTFSIITAAGFTLNPGDVAFLDGYFIVTNAITNQFSISALNDGLNWDALDFEKISSKADTLIGVRVLKRRIFLFGRKATEVWFNAGAADFPFRRDNNLLLEYGCASAGSIATGYQKMFWLSGDKNGVGSVMMTDGTTPIPISNTAIDFKLQNYSNINDADALVYKIDGHVFYQLNFTTDNHTWIYDANTMHWFEGEMLNGDRRITNNHTFFNNKHYVGSYNTPNIYELSSFAYTDELESGVKSPIKRKRITGHFSESAMRKIRITRVNLDVVPGVGLRETPETTIDTNYSEPSVFLSFSKDGGNLFCNKRKSTLGKSGDRLHRCIYRRLGSARDWVFCFESICESPVYWLGGSIDYEVSGR